MYSHPALLRELTLCADLLRRSGEAAWARVLLQTTDRLRKSGWTEAGRQVVLELFEQDPGIEAVSFGSEHGRWLKGPAAVEAANTALRARLDHIKALGAEPRVLPEPGPRKRSPDLA